MRKPSAALLLVLLCAPGPAPAAADLPAAAPTFFAGNPATEELAFRYRVGLRALGWSDDGTGVYGLFSQSSFWLLDGVERGYTVENVFAPEVMARVDGRSLAGALSWWPSRLDLGLSYSHHSNGLNGALSRSWNHLNGYVYWGHPDRDPVSGSVTGWYPFNVEATNPDIDRYAGQGRIALQVRPAGRLPVLGRTRLYLASTFSFDSADGGFLTHLETSLGFAPDWLTRPPFPGREARFGLFVQWVVGRGESLIEYRRYRNTVRFGLELW